MLHRFSRLFSTNLDARHSRRSHHVISARLDHDLYLLTPHVEVLENRHMLSSVFPAFVDGQFTFGDPSSPAPYGLENTFHLSSRPSATKTIYLDYTGHHSVNNAWGHDIVFPAFDRDGDPSTFSDDELIEIQVNFQSVAEDYLPFDVNVTTQEPPISDLVNTGGIDERWGIRALQTQATGGFGNGIGGVAMLFSFDWNEDTPAFSFNKGHVNGSLTISHEVGHTVGLLHDGLDGLAYHPGTGTGETGWGPIMGAPFGKNVVHFSNGDYPGSNNTEDDFDLVTTENGFGYRPDDHGDIFSGATKMTQDSPTEVSAWGVINDRDDVDFFKFNTGDGFVSFDIEPYGVNPNLDILATVYDSRGNVLGEFNPLDDTNGSFSMPLFEDTYFVSIDGTGRLGRYSDYGSVGFYTIVGTVAETDIDAGVIIGETGTVQASNFWTTVQLDNEYENPVVVAGPGTDIRPDPYTVRINNVTNDSFDIRIEEWGYLDRQHGNETIGFMVVEAGTHQFSNGTTIIAGTSMVNHEWSNVYFDVAYGEIPIVLSQVATSNGGQPVVTRTRAVDEVGFQIRLQEEEAANQIHNPETVNWISINSGSGQLGDLTFETVLAPNSVGHKNRKFDFATQSFGTAPVLLGNIQTYIGQNTVNLRMKNINANSVTLFAEEEQSLDNEILHVPEGVGYTAIQSGDIVLKKPIGESGTVINVDDQWQHVQLENSYLNPVVIASPPTARDVEPVTVRVRNVTSNGFDIRIHEWNYLDQKHGEENVDFLVLEAGTHKLTDGRVISAGTAQVNHDFASISFEDPFDEAPVVLTQVNTTNGFSTVTTRNRNITSAGFETRLQEEEAADDRHSLETVAWVAVEEGSGTTGGKLYDAFAREREVDHIITDVNFTFDFVSIPNVFADMQSYYGNNTATLRFTDVTPIRVSMFVEEEQSLDQEVGHGLEDVGVFAIKSGAVAGFTVNAQAGGGTGGNIPLADSNSEYRLVRIPRITSIKDPVAYHEMTLPFPEHLHHHDDNHVALGLHDHEDHNHDHDHHATHLATTDSVLSAGIEANQMGLAALPTMPRGTESNRPEVDRNDEHGELAPLRFADQLNAAGTATIYTLGANDVIRDVETRGAETDVLRLENERVEVKKSSS